MQTSLFRPHNRQRWFPQAILLLAALGCLYSTVAFAQSPPTPPATTNTAPTYLRDILPIIMGKCSRCHNEQARFVYNWLDFRTAYADRWEIKRRVWDSWREGLISRKPMPIANSPESLALTEEERLAIRHWVDDGGPRGVAPPAGAPKSRAERIELGRRLFSSHLRGLLINRRARDCRMCFHLWRVRIF